MVDLPYRRCHGCSVIKEQILCYAMLAIMEISALKTVQISQYMSHYCKIRTEKRNEDPIDRHPVSYNILKMNLGYYGAAFMWTNIKL